MKRVKFIRAAVCVSFVFLLSGCGASSEEEMERCKEAVSRVEAMEAVKIDSVSMMTDDGETGESRSETWHIDGENWMSVNEFAGQKTWILERDGRQYSKTMVGDNFQEEAMPWYVLDNPLEREERVKLLYEEYAVFTEAEKEGGMRVLTWEVPGEELQTAWEQEMENRELPEDMREDIVGSTSRPTMLQFLYYLDEDGNLEKLVANETMEERKDGEKTGTLGIASTVTYTEVSAGEAQKVMDEVYAEIPEDLTGYSG